MEVYKRIYCGKITYSKEACKQHVLKEHAGIVRSRQRGMADEQFAGYACTFSRGG